ncbi:5-dehydro-4-deoxy-D-glucuronate isomerase [Bosea caraganae]|uniref:4-deoxy-L-threo-5-hexosulose-uronate ketol-isomerase n=1 Tax=Bosea caraganae TaxID=2763117 RepID=A0A370L0I9_9HYPH|nr:5-dehydro-4-deoxy-D-glucuronate isomerase [Bosea caraganae]RDJ20372.1 5-dehydro-4-deoxy-D-glucuronate isomerase [Bosea caraganae]RDJ26547.1 5-dehydro-4-deoxy-D-glucuronate isomerase [Bosea caraganae]
MTIDIRQVSHPEAVRSFDTAALRRHFLLQDMFRPGEVSLTYSHIERFVIGGAVPMAKPLVLPAPKPLGTASFLARRELGIFNIGGAGSVRVGDSVYQLDKRDALYAGMGAGEVSFESRDPANPARFYLLSTPAHASYDTVLIKLASAKTMTLGEQASGNRRSIAQMIHPDVCKTCQLVMGMTTLDEGNLWNTMPTHVHDRRSEVYLYFDLDADARVIHLMGEPDETRHLIVANEEAILSPNWSIHSGVGTRAYTFIWGMGGDNIDYTDMDKVPMDALR